MVQHTDSERLESSHWLQDRQKWETRLSFIATCKHVILRPSLLATSEVRSNMVTPVEHLREWRGRMKSNGPVSQSIGVNDQVTQGAAQDGGVTDPLLWEPITSRGAK